MWNLGLFGYRSGPGVGVGREARLGVVEIDLRKGGSSVVAKIELELCSVGMGERCGASSSSARDCFPWVHATNIRSKDKATHIHFGRVLPFPSIIIISYI